MSNFSALIFHRATADNLQIGVVREKEEASSPITTFGFIQFSSLVSSDALQLFCCDSYQFPGLSCGSDPMLPGNVWAGRIGDAVQVETL